MHLVQLLLPLRDNEGHPFPAAAFEEVLDLLTVRFGGVTAYLRSPAAGAWVDEGRIDRDSVVMIEVMCETLDRDWWRDYRGELERRFRQDAVLIRATQADLL